MVEICVIGCTKVLNLFNQRKCILHPRIFTQQVKYLIAMKEDSCKASHVIAKLYFITVRSRALYFWQIKAFYGIVLQWWSQTGQTLTQQPFTKTAMFADRTRVSFIHAWPVKLHLGIGQTLEWLGHSGLWPVFEKSILRKSNNYYRLLQ